MLIARASRLAAGMGSGELALVVDLLKRHGFPPAWPDAMLRVAAGAPEPEPSGGSVQPPKNWELLLHLIVPPLDCDRLAGDLEEHYRKLAVHLGQGRANIWYAKQVLTSIGPLLRDSMRRGGSSGVVGVIAFVLRFFGLGRTAEQLKRVAGRQRRQRP